MVIFVVAFIMKENIEWIFEKFIECMGSSPKTIITNQNLAMKVELEKVFPSTFHHLCKWQIANIMGNKNAMIEFYWFLNDLEYCRISDAMRMVG